MTTSSSHGPNLLDQARRDHARYRRLLEQAGGEIRDGAARRIYCSRDLNMEGVHWVGFDMDYTLAVYNQEVFDALCHEHTLDRLIRAFGYPESLRQLPYDPGFGIRGLVIDRKLGHVIKMDAHGHVDMGTHGFRRVPHPEIEEYRKAPPNLADDRYMGVDTLFELPEVYLYAAIVEHEEDAGRPINFMKLGQDLREAIDTVHRDGTLKSIIVDDLPRYIQRDPELPTTLHRLRSAGKKLFLLSNSPAKFTDRVMHHLLDGGHPGYEDWRAWFDIIISDARKPNFFAKAEPFVALDHNLEPTGETVEQLQRGVMYERGNIGIFENSIGAHGDEILYVGDHIYGDIVRSKRDSRWRTLMIIPELDTELHSLAAQESRILEWGRLEEELSIVRDTLLLQHELRLRLTNGTLADVANADWLPAARAAAESDSLARHAKELVHHSRMLADEIDAQFHHRWGSLMKAGNEHSGFGQLVERYADLYTSRVTNLLTYSTAQYFRSPRDPLPHETEMFQTTEST